MVDRPSSGETYAYKRRSTRLLHTVPVSVAGQDAAGRPLAEQTATISLNCHGCRYFSRFRVERNSWLTLEIPGAPPREPSRRLRARVAWIEKSRRLAGLFQVAVEFESPANVWGITKPPQDWQDFVTAAALDHAATQAEINRLLAVTKNGNYYELLGVSAVSSHAQIRGRFYDLARKFHPDRHMSHPEWTDSLHRLMDTLTLAYKTLSNDKAREQYDRRLASSGAFTLGHSKSETQKTAEECLAKGRECLRMQNFAGSIVWLRKAVGLEPESSKYHALLARSLAAVPQYRREAMQHFEKALELDPLNLWARFHYGGLLEELDLPWRARPQYLRILELDAEHSGARERLQVLDAGKSRPRPSVRILQRLFSRDAK